MNKIRVSELLAHLVFLVFCIFILNRIFYTEETLFERAANSDIIKIVNRRSLLLLITAVLFCKALFVYINFHLLKRNESGRSRLYKRSGIVLMLCILLEIILCALVYKIEGGIKIENPWKYIAFDILLYIFYAGLGYAFYFWNKWRISEQLQKETESKQLKAELGFLRNQLNPHFLFNVLNNIFSIAVEKQQELIAKSVSDLSSMMRYLLYESSADKIQLEKEVQTIESLIDLYVLKLENKDLISVTFIKEGDLQQHIAPLILLTFVENALKHGISTSETSAIHISLTVDSNYMIFKIKNTIHTQLNKSGDLYGIGLENVKRRLELLYGGNYTLKFISSPGEYNVDLQLILT